MPKGKKIEKKLRDRMAGYSKMLEEARKNKSFNEDAYRRPGSRNGRKGS